MQRTLVRLVALAGVYLGARGAQAREGDLVRLLPFAVPSPQDIALDTSDGTYWVTTFLQNTVYHYTADLGEVIESFQEPVGPNRYLSGIAYNSVDGTLLVGDTVAGKILELDRSGLATGREIVPQFLDLVNAGGRPVPLGFAFHAGGDGGRGSIYVVEAMGTLIYELNLSGEPIRYFSHPDDPDGFPGEGANAVGCSDVDVILDGDALAGFYVTGSARGGKKIRRLDADGTYRGVTIDLDEAGGTVSGLIRVPIQLPGSAQPIDAFVCVVSSSAQFAILEGGEPDFREVLDFTCEQAGDEVLLSWSNPQTYEGIEIREGCDILADLPGGTSEWRHRFEMDGVHRLSLRAFAGGLSSEPPPCEVVVGGGQVLATSEIEGDPGEYLIPLDVTSDDAGHVIVSANVSAGSQLASRILIFDDALALLESFAVPESFSGPKDYTSGIAHGRPGGEDRIFLFNASTSTVGVFDVVGALLGTFPAGLPNLEEDPEKEPDYGFVVGMTYDSDGNGGSGSLWLVETALDRIYEIDLEGNVLRDLPHPYRAIEPPPEDTPYGTGSSGIAKVPGSGGARFYLSGGTLRDSGQPHIFEIRKDTGEVVPGTVLPSAAIQKYGATSSMSFEAVVRGEEPRLIVLTRAGSRAALLEVQTRRPAVAKPTFLRAQQESLDDQAALRFVNHGPYDRVEVFRDCAKVADLRGDSTFFLDPNPGPGVHEYAVRGAKDGATSALETASVRVGIGAVLERTILWPAISPQQLAVDPLDDLTVVVGSYPRDERNLHFFGEGFEYLESREILYEPPWEVATLAIRHLPRQSGEIFYIVWQQPVALGSVGSQQFFLVTESIAGEFLGASEIFPPIPTNGFVVFPAGLTWSPRSDTFYYLERNSKTYVELGRDGVALRTFPHPDPPFQNFVFGLGLTLAPERGTLFFTTAGRRDHRITVAREMTLAGALTGASIPLDAIPNSIGGIAIRGNELITVGTDRFPEIMRIKAFEEPPGTFIRGDSDADGEVGISDPIVTLGHLFLGGTEPPCLDAADADDSGRVDLTDGILTLLVLFAGYGDLPPPYPKPGIDPTPDALECL